MKVAHGELGGRPWNCPRPPEIVVADEPVAKDVAAEESLVLFPNLLKGRLVGFTPPPSLAIAPPMADPAKARWEETKDIYEWEVKGEDGRGHRLGIERRSGGAWRVLQPR
ncbi:hypothetical protein GUJ93_ZPchr0002g24237 [Zizania palustris]|uniref:Uncharacterized protein n=1 Tax=Zizania palustris TaxID=103762 RepID=A0A8J5SAB7_ZIZPA|nr:hypothetical protein GUJ93_ZPchr0002g24237 [Zizania palustris]